MRTRVGAGRPNARLAPSTTTDVSALDPPAALGVGDDPHSRNTSSVTGRSGVNTSRCVPVTLRPAMVTPAVSTGRCGSSARYDEQPAAETGGAGAWVAVGLATVGVAEGVAVGLLVGVVAGRPPGLLELHAVASSRQVSRADGRGTRRR
jgi:hypothetical protein